MSILGSIVSKILGHHGDATPAPTGSTASAASASPAGRPPSATPASDLTRTPPIAAGPAPSTPPASGAPAIPATADAGPSGRAPAASVDVAAVLNGLAAQSREKLDWKHSIVDMMKLLGLDSSLSARQALAQELHYSGDTRDSASMNVWLHGQVMRELAENGGKVPDDLKA